MKTYLFVLIGSVVGFVLGSLMNYGSLSKNNTTVERDQNQYLESSLTASESRLSLVTLRNTELGQIVIENSAINEVGLLAKEYPHLFQNHLDVNRILSGIAFDLLESDPASAAKLLDRFTHENTRLGVQESIISAWTEIDPEQAVLWLEEKIKINPGEYEGYYAYALNSLARQSPAKAITIFDTLTPGQPARSAIVQGIAAGWGATDPEVGFDILQRLQGEPDMNSQLLQSVYKDLMLGYMNLDREAAASAIADLSSIQLQKELIQPLVLKYGDSSFNEAVSFIGTINDKAVKKAASQHFIEILGPKYPKEMIDFALNKLDVNSGNQNHLKQAFLSLTLSDSKEAMKQYRRLQGNSKAAAMESIAYTMSRTHNQHEVSEWISSLPEQEDRDYGYAALAINSRADPYTMFESLSNIENSDRKYAALKTVVNQASPNHLFELQRLLQSSKFEGTDSKKISDLINYRIESEYGDLVTPVRS